MAFWRRLLLRVQGRWRYPHAQVYGEVHRGARIEEGVWIPYGVRVDATAEIGRYSYVLPRTHLQHVRIGAFCSIAEDLRLIPYAHPLAHVSTYPFHARLGMSLPYPDQEFLGRIEIGPDVWIGARVVIKGGVRIGAGAVIGAHSVVTRDVPPYCVVAGAPARVLRQRFDDATIARLLEIRWWEWPLAEIRARMNELERIVRNSAK